MIKLAYDLRTDDWRPKDLFYKMVSINPVQVEDQNFNTDQETLNQINTCEADRSQSSMIYSPCDFLL